ncbi:hypothetical protein, partial [Laspinema olomoucense]
TGTDESHSLNLISSADGVNFENKITLPETSFTAPALAVFDNRLYLAWTGTDESHSLNLISSADGVNFENKITLQPINFPPSSFGAFELSRLGNTPPPASPFNETDAIENQETEPTTTSPASELEGF